MFYPRVKSSISSKSANQHLCVYPTVCTVDACYMPFVWLLWYVISTKQLLCFSL